MKHFANRMAALFSSGPSAPVAARLSASDVAERQSLAASMWDEALAASTFDENARMLLDHWGPRWK